MPCHAKRDRQNGSRPAASGIAILKYRLYDLDVVVKKTVVFGALLGFGTVKVELAQAVVTRNPQKTEAMLSEVQSDAQDALATRLE